MSQDNTISTVDQRLSDSPNTTSDNNNGWANFDTFKIPETNNDDDWADFESSTKSDLNKTDDDEFGDYGESQISPSSSDTLTTEQIQSIISTCFPLEPSTDTNNFIPFELPTLTTFKDPIKQLSSFKHSLSLWNNLSNVSTDPIGIQYQWRKSNCERLFHQALHVQERFHPKPIPIISENSQSELPAIISNTENTLPDIRNSSPSTNSIKIETDVFDSNSSPIIHRNNSPIPQQQSRPIKTLDLFPGSTTTLLNEDVKTVAVDPVPNFSFINPKALMFSNPINTESTSLY